MDDSAHHREAALPGTLLSPEQAADLLGIPHAAVMAAIAGGDLKAVRLPTAKGKAARYRITFGELMDTYAGQLLTVTQAAALLGVGRRKMFYLLSDGHIGSILLPSPGGGRNHQARRIPRARIAAFIARLEQEEGAARAQAAATVPA